MSYNVGALDTLVEQFERIPEVGESFVWHGLKVTVTEMDDARIIRLRVEMLPDAEEQEDD